MRRTMACIVLVIAMAGLAIGCGDDDKSDSSADPLLDAYYTSLRSIGSEFLDALAQAPEGLDQSAPIAEQVNIYEAYSRGAGDSIRVARDGLRDLDPPPEVASLHAELLASVENALTVEQSFEDQLGAIESAQELQQLVSTPDVADAFQRFQTACIALRDYATAHSVAGVVRCE